MNQKGFISLATLLTIIVSSAFSLIFYFISVSISSISAIPYIFVSFFIFPIAIIPPMLKDLTELQEINGTTRTEKKRLSQMVLSIQKRLRYLAIALLSFGILSGVLLYLTSNNILNVKMVFSLIGFFLGYTICGLISVITIRINTQNYKSKVYSRIEDLKQRRKMLQKMQSSPTDKK
ncbi:hypothetical protein [Photobacterium damselae]|uniref:hypothetical protein n=1 Tax=Photobacterium damselae TaxID=38293 RepID=UPI0025432915